MIKLKLFGLSFTFIFFLTATLCFLLGKPLVFMPGYSFSQFVGLAILLGFLVYCMVYINFPLLDWIKGKLFKNSDNLLFYTISTFILLQLATLCAGYLESSLSRGRQADWFFYYSGITNSYIFLFSGNVTAMLASWYYIKMKKQSINSDRGIIEN